VFGDSSCFDDAMEGPSCRWLMRDLLYYTSVQIENVLDKYTTTITSTRKPDPALLPARSTKIDPDDSFTRLPDDEIHCENHFYQEPTNINGDPVTVLWQVCRTFCSHFYLTYTVAFNVHSTRKSYKSVASTCSNTNFTGFVFFIFVNLT